MKFRLSATLLALTATACLLLALAPAASASDGVILITQATAAHGLPNCPNDGQSLITICQPGSYRLAGNLSATAASTNGIDINASGVALDLNGFSITPGPNNSIGGDFGIFSQASHVTVSNGFILGFGMNLGGTAESVNAVSLAPGGTGITIGSGLVQNCTITGAYAGIHINQGGAVEVLHCVITDFEGQAIYSLGQALVIGSTIQSSAPNSAGILPAGGTMRVTGSSISAYDCIFAPLPGEVVIYGDNILSGRVQGGTSLHTNYCTGVGSC